MHKDNIKYALSTEAFQSLPNLFYWPKGKHQFTYSFQLPQQLLVTLNKQYPGQNFTKLFYSLTQGMADVVLEYLPRVANISFTEVDNHEIADLHFLHSDRNKIEADVIGEATPILSYCNKIESIVIGVSEAQNSFWEKTCISHNRVPPICIFIMAHELMHALGFFHHPFEGYVRLPNEHQSQNMTVLSYGYVKQLRDYTFQRRILMEEHLWHNPLTLMPLDALVLRERYGPPQNPLTGNLTLDFYHDYNCRFPWLRYRYYGVLSNCHMQLHEDFRLRYRITIPESLNLTLVFDESKPLVIDTRRGSQYITYVHKESDYFLRDIPENDFVYQLGCHTHIARVITGAGVTTIFDNADNIQYQLRSYNSSTELYFPYHSGHDVIQGFNPFKHRIIKECDYWQLKQGNTTTVITFNSGSIEVDDFLYTGDNLKCAKVDQRVSECVQINDHAAINTLDDFCLNQVMIDTLFNAGNAFIYSVEVIFIRLVMIAALKHMKLPSWSIMLANELLTLALLLAQREIELVVLLLCGLRPLMFLASAPDEVINIVESNLFCIKSVKGFSSLTNAADSLVSCGASMFGAWVGQKVYKRLAAALTTLTEPNENVMPNQKIS